MPSARRFAESLGIEHGLAFLAIASPISKSFTYAAFGVTAALFLLDWRRGRIAPRATPIDAALGLWAVSQVLSTIVSVDPVESVRDLRSIGYWGIFYLAAWGVASGAPLGLLSALWLGAGALAAVQGVAEATVGFDLLHARREHASGFFTGHLPFGHYQAMLFALAFALLRESRERRTQILFGILAVLFAAGVVASKGRGPWLALALVGLAIAFAAARRRLVVAIVVVAAIQVAVVARDPGGIGAFYGSYVALEREEGGEVPDEALYSNLWRLSMWREGLRAFANRPLLGNGIESIGALSPEFHVPFADFGVAHLHSNYLEVAASRGLLGLTAFYALGIALVGALRRGLGSAGPGVERAVVVAALGAVLIHAAHGLTYYSIGSAPIQMGFYWIAGAGIGVALRGDPARPPSLALAPLFAALAFVLVLSPLLERASPVALGLAAVAVADAAWRILRGRASVWTGALVLAFATIALAVSALLVPPVETRALALRVLTAAAAPFALAALLLRLSERFVESSREGLVESPPAR